MNKFDKDTFIKLHDKYNNFTDKLSNISSKKYKNQITSFNDFLINFYLNNQVLYENAIVEDDNYYIINGGNIINEFLTIEFNNYKKFLVKNHTHFDSITAECIYLSNN